MPRRSASLSLLFLLPLFCFSSAFLAPGRLPARTNAFTAASISPRTRSNLFNTRMSVDPAAVAELVAKIEKVADGGKAPKQGKKVLKALKKNSGAVMVASEYSRADAEAKDGEHGVDFRTFSLYLRRNKAAALLVDCAAPAGLADLEAFVEEQASAKGNFPGPVPVLRSGEIAGAEQVAEAKAAGAEGVVVSMSQESAEEVLSACAALGMEALCVVADAGQVEAAIGAGSKLICTAAHLPAAEASALVEGLGKDVAALALIDSRMDGGPEGLQKIFDTMKEEKLDENEAPKLEVVTRGLELREGKFNALLLSAACKDADDKSEVGFHHFLLETLQSKKSSAYAKMAKIKNPLGTGRPPAKLEGFTTVLEGSRPS